MQDKVIHFDITLQIGYLDADNCNVSEFMNKRICTICQGEVGTTRPLGIGWGKLANEEEPHGLRLCNSCYTFCMKLSTTAIAPVLSEKVPT